MLQEGNNCLLFLSFSHADRCLTLVLTTRRDLGKQITQALYLFIAITDANFNVIISLSYFLLSLDERREEKRQRLVVTIHCEG